ncbi:hypothetical protein DRQ29_07645 [bacterium]|nr:MAG: hypothetical protein DRQ29_07645 [bacterium]
MFAVDSDGYTNLPGEATRYGFNYLGPYSGNATYFLETLSRNWRVPFGAGEFYFQISVAPIEMDGVGVAKIILYAFNGDAIPHDIGAMLGFDMLIGSNDRPRFSTGSSLLSEGTLLSDDNIPYFWQAFEVSPGAGCEQVIARGYLRGLDATPPDRFALADNYFLQMHPWEIDSDFIGLPYNDSAILMRWAKQRINPDKAVSFTTYLGFGKCVMGDTDILLIPLVPSRLMPQCDDIESPFETAVLIHNLSLTEGLSAAEICIHIPDGTELEIDPLHSDDTCLSLEIDPLLPESSAVESWIVGIEDTSLWGDSIPIIISLSGEPSVELAETSWVSIPHPDGNIPLCELDFTYHYIGCSDSGSVMIPFYLWDDTGIDSHSVSVKLGEHILLAVSGFLHFTDESLYVEIPQWMLVCDETLSVEMISATDVYGCSPVEFPPVETLFVDLEPPIFIGFDPPDSNSISISPQIRLLIDDKPAGIDRMSVDILFDGSHIPPDDPQISWESDSILVFTSSETFPESYPLTICLMSVADNTELCGPHISDTPVCATYTVSSITENRKPPDKPFLWINPNPFNYSCKISIYAPQLCTAKIEIFDIHGRIIKKVNLGGISAGNHNIRWQPDKNLPSGIYFIDAAVGNYKLKTSVLFIK